MKRSLRAVATLVLTLVFLFSMGMYLKNQRETAAGSDSYTQALTLATGQKTLERTEQALPAEEQAEPTRNAEPVWTVAAVEEEDPHIRELEQLDLEALRQVNPDVIGWIRIPDTAVDYPLMQGTDNDFYLEHSWDENKSIMGSIFLEYQNAPDLTDFNTMVYGHNMDNGSMFASIRYYNHQGHFEEHPYVYVRSDAGVYRYEIFSSYLAEVESNTYGLEFPSQRSQSRFLEEITENSVIETGIEPEITDRILTLSTCSGMGYSNRWVVHARLKMILTAEAV